MLFCTIDRRRLAQLRPRILLLPQPIDIPPPSSLDLQCIQHAQILAGFLRSPRIWELGCIREVRLLRAACTSSWLKTGTLTYFVHIYKLTSRG